MHNLETRGITLPKSRQLVVRQPEDFAQHADDFVARLRIDHNREQRGQPRICGIFTLPVTLRLDFDCKIDIEQRVTQRAQPCFPWTQNCNLSPRIGAQFFETGRANPIRQFTRLYRGASRLGQIRIDVLVEIEPDYLSGQNIRPRIELNELNLAADVVQNFVEHFIHKIELPPIEPEGNREF